MNEVYVAIAELLEKGQRGAVATLIGATGSTPGKEGAKMLVRDDGSTVGTIGGGCVEADVWALAREAMDTDQPLRRQFRLTPESAEADGLACGGTADVFIEPLGKPTLVVFGAGHIAERLVPLAKGVGFGSIVVDDRERFANRERFPDADRIVVSEFAASFEHLDLGPSSHVVIVTRGHRHDQLVLERSLPSSAATIGLIGSRAKIARIYRHLVREGADPDRLRRVQAPIGLDIGSQTPEEIAISIVAELVAWRRRAHWKGDDARRADSRSELVERSLRAEGSRASVDSDAPPGS